MKETKMKWSETKEIVKNPNYAIREAFDENGCIDNYNPKLCYHKFTGCRAMTPKGTCACLTDTMFFSQGFGTYDCPFYKTEEQFSKELIECKLRLRTIENDGKNKPFTL